MYPYNVAASGTFTMEGGEISGNSASSSGGGVYVGYDGTFTMEGGEISGNSASASSSSSYGGGVYVTTGTFTMEEGEISGNSASASSSSSYGGGVYVTTGISFTKTGGTIYGYTENDPLSNTVRRNVVQTGKGHAVYVNATHYRDTTVTADQDMSKSGSDYTGAWTD
jgi:hypothetical protein